MRRHNLTVLIEFTKDNSVQDRAIVFGRGRWSVVMLFRPTVIAITFNARNRGTGLIQELVDWRLMVRPGTSSTLLTLQYPVDTLAPD